MIEFELSDMEDPTITVNVKVKVNENGNLTISIDGYGDKASRDGEGDPILLELNNGKLQLFVWSDINKEYHTHRIELENARESNRAPER